MQSFRILKSRLQILIMTYLMPFRLILCSRLKLVLLALKKVI